MKDKLAFLTPDERIILTNDIAFGALIDMVSNLTGDSPKSIRTNLGIAIGNFVLTLTEDEIKTRIENIRANEREGREAAIRDFKASNN